MSAIPIGVPGWPECAFSTASTARKRIVLTHSSSSLSFLPTRGRLLSSATEIAAAPSAAVLPGVGSCIEISSCGCAGRRVKKADYTRRSPTTSDHIQAAWRVSDMVDESVTVKGSPVRSLQKFVDAELTPEQRDAVLRSLPPEYAKRFSA